MTCVASILWSSKSHYCARVGTLTKVQKRTNSLGLHGLIHHDGSGAVDAKLDEKAPNPGRD